jgi:hypothetical protein
MAVTTVEKIQLRRDTAANWTSANPTLSAGELGFETDTGKFKLGTGSTTWTSLGYAAAIPGAIVNADVSNTAAIAYSKLSLSNSIVNADINSSAAIAYSKLSLSDSIVNADINASAAIADTKLATISTAGKVSGTAITSGDISTSGSFTSSSFIASSSASAGIGYSTGAGGTVTQATSKATAVTLNTVTGQITTTAASLAAATIVSFTLNNSAITAEDAIVINHASGGTLGAYTVNAAPAAGSATISIRNNTTGALAQALVLRFAIITSVNA